MGTWKKDQSKHDRRYEWGTTRGEKDAVWRDVAARLKSHSLLSSLRHEKIGAEIHFFRLMKDPSGTPFWSSCLRLIDDGWGYWTLQWRPDEGRWRTSAIRDLPVGRMLTVAEGFYREKSHEFL